MTAARTAQRLAAAVTFVILADTAAAMVSPLLMWLAAPLLIAATAWRTALLIEQDRLAARAAGTSTRKDRAA